MEVLPLILLDDEDHPSTNPSHFGSTAFSSSLLSAPFVKHHLQQWSLASSLTLPSPLEPIPTGQEQQEQRQRPVLRMQVPIQTTPTQDKSNTTTNKEKEEEHPQGTSRNNKSKPLSSTSTTTKQPTLRNLHRLSMGYLLVVVPTTNEREPQDSSLGPRRDTVVVDTTTTTTTTTTTPTTETEKDLRPASSSSSSSPPPMVELFPVTHNNDLATSGIVVPMMRLPSQDPTESRGHFCCIRAYCGLSSHDTTTRIEPNRLWNVLVTEATLVRILPPHMARRIHGTRDSTTTTTPTTTTTTPIQNPRDQGLFQLRRQHQHL